MKKNILWNTAGNLFYGICTWVITVLVVHLTDYNEAGYLALAIAMTNTYEQIAWFNMRNYQVTDAAGRFSDSQYVSSRVISCTVAFLMLIIAAFTGSGFYQALCIIAYMPIRIAESVSDVCHGINQKKERYDYIGKSFILRGIGMVGVFSVGLILLKKLAIVLLLTAAYQLCVSFFFDCRKTFALTEIKLKLFDKDLINLYRDCLPLVVFAFFLSAQNNHVKQTIQELCGNDIMGIYSSIASPTIAVQMIAVAIFAPFLPGLSVLLAEKEYDAFQKKLLKIYAAFVAMAVVVLAGAMLLGRWGLALLYPDDILDHYEFFMPVVIVTILYAVVLVMQGILVAIRKIWIMTIGMVADFLLLVVLIKPMIGLYGANGGSFAQILSFAAYIPFAMITVYVTIRREKKKAFDK